MKDITDPHIKKLQQVNAANALISIIRGTTKGYVKAHHQADENGNLNVDKEEIFKEVLSSPNVEVGIRTLFDLLWDDTFDELTYAARKEWQEKKDQQKLDNKEEPLM